MLDLDLAPEIAAPFRYRRGHRGRDKALLGQHPDQGIDHRFGHGKAEQRRVDADAAGVALGDHLAVMHHDHRLGAPERRLGRLLEGVIERGLQCGIGRRHDIGAGNLAQQRRRFRYLQCVDVALEDIRLLRSVPQHAAEPFMIDSAAAEHSRGRCIDRPGRAVDLELQQRAHAAQRGTLDGFREHGLRIEPGNEGLGADTVRDHAGGDADRAIGTEDDASRRRHGQTAIRQRSNFASPRASPQPIVSSATASPRQPRAAPAR